MKEKDSLKDEKAQLRKKIIELEQSVLLFKETEKTGKIGGWQFDPVTLKQIWTDEVFRILEIDLDHGAPEVPKGLEFIDPEFRPMAEKAIQAAIEHGKPYNQEWMVTTNKGNKKWVNAVCRPKMKNGKIVAISGSFQDITSEKIVKEELKKSEERLRRVFDNSPFPIAVVDEKGQNILFWSKSAIQLFGHNPKTSEEWYELAYPDPEYRQQVIERWKPFLETAQTSRKAVNTGEYEIHCKNGSVKICEIYAQFIPGSLIVTLNDVTQRKKSEEELKELNQLLVADERQAMAAIQQLQAGEQQLIAANQQLQANEQQLKAAVQQLQAGEQQLIAANQQLQANEQQLRAANQQLIASEKQLKLANNKIRENEERLNLVIKASNDAPWDWDLIKDELFYSPQWWRQIGYKPNEIFPNSSLWEELMHPDDNSEVDKIFKGALEKGIESYQVEFRLKHKKGHYVPVLSRGLITFDENKKPIRVTGTNLDLTEWKKNELALTKAKEKAEENEAMLLAAMENSQAGIAIAEVPSGKLSYVNKAALLIRDKNYDEIVKNIDLENYVESWQILHLDGTPYKTDEVPLARAVLYGESNSKEFIVRRDDNEDRYVWANAAPILDEKGKQIAAIVVFLDITDKKLSELSLNKANRELNKVQEITQVGSWYLDIATNEVVWSKELYKMYGFDPNLPVPPYTEHMKLFTPESWEILSASLAKTSEKGIPYELELRTVRNDKSNGWMWVRGEALFDENKKIVGLWGAAQDISESKNIEEELIKAKEHAEESDRLKSAFLANMSHEIRTPMNGILGFTNLLLKPNLTGEDQQKYIDIIQKSGVRMLNTVNDIIDISRIESGLIELSLSEVNINNQLNYLHSFFIPEAVKKGIHLIVINDISEYEKSILTDLEKFNSILTNLIKNAIKFTNQGTIELGYNINKSKGLTKLKFYVKDSGIGIPKNRQEAIFDRFIQADIEDREAKQGSGLGLAISKAYAEMLGGEIWVDSREGKGSTFYFTIEYHPVSGSKSDAKKGDYKLEKDNASSKLKVLVVEDDETSELLISILLKKFAKEIIYARTGFEAIEACRNNDDIDLILMDIQLPDMNGYKATRQIRQFNKDVVILAQTAYALNGDKEEAMSVGCNDYISKPINESKLNSLIKKYSKKYPLSKKN